MNFRNWRLDTPFLPYHLCDLGFFVVIISIYTVYYVEVICKFVFCKGGATEEDRIDCGWRLFARIGLLQFELCYGLQLSAMVE